MPSLLTREKTVVKKVPASVQLLLLQLKNSDASTRRNGGETIPTLHAPAEPLTDSIGELFGHENWYVRQSAAEALSHCVESQGAADLATRVVAAPYMDDKDEQKRRCAGDTLTRIVSIVTADEGNESNIKHDPETARAAATEAAARLKSEDPGVRRNAIDTLSHMGRCATPHASEIGERLADPDISVRNAAVRAFTVLGTAAAGGAPEAGVLLAHADPVVRRTGARGIIALAAHSGAAAADGVAAQLHHQNPTTRTAAALCLADLGPLAAPHGKELAQLLEDEDVHVRCAAVRALAHAGPKVAAHMAHIKARLGHSNPNTRRAAVDTIRSLAGTCASFAQAMGKTLHEETQQQTADVIRQMQQILTILGGAGRNAVPYLADIARELEAGDWAIRQASIEALCDLGEHADKAAKEVARRLLHPDRDTRRAAAEALGRMGTHAGEYGRRVEALLDTEEDEDVRRTCEVAAQRLHEAGVLHNEDSGPGGTSSTASPNVKK
jgi:HEAT repeat protein